MPLEAKDLWSLKERDSSKVMVPKLLKEWEKEQTKAKRYVCKISEKYQINGLQHACFTRIKALLGVKVCEIKTVTMYTYKDSRLLGEIR